MRKIYLEGCVVLIIGLVFFSAHILPEIAGRSLRQSFHEENHAWRDAYAAVQTGTEIASVESRFRALEPAPYKVTRDHWNVEHGADTKLTIRGPRRWEYSFSFDHRGKMLKKCKRRG